MGGMGAVLRTPQSMQGLRRCCVLPVVTCRGREHKQGGHEHGGCRSMLCQRRYTCIALQVRCCDRTLVCRAATHLRCTPCCCPGCQGRVLVAVDIRRDDHAVSLLLGRGAISLGRRALVQVLHLQHAQASQQGPAAVCMTQGPTC